MKNPGSKPVTPDVQPRHRAPRPVVAARVAAMGNPFTIIATLQMTVDRPREWVSPLPDALPDPLPQPLVLHKVHDSGVQHVCLIQVLDDAAVVPNLMFARAGTIAGIATSIGERSAEWRSGGPVPDRV